MSTTTMPKESSRPALPTSATDFALPPSSSNCIPGYDDLTAPALQRLRRPAVWAPTAAYMSDSVLSSPFGQSFTPSKLKQERTGSFVLEEAFVMRSDSSQSSGSETATPPLATEDDIGIGKSLRSKPVLTPPRRSSSASIESQDAHNRHRRRLSHPIKFPRILNLLAESRPMDDEVKSEAAFQRLISGAELSTHPRVHRAPSDRGRYPEEAGDDDSLQPEDASSDDDPDLDDTTFAFYPTSSSEPIAINKSRTPAGSVNGDDSGISESPYGMAMDVDLPSRSPSLASMSSTPATHWRYTPPPTSATSAIRSNKRKFDDRYDPYATASKRRAVSPSMTYLRDSHSNLSSPITRNPPRLPIAIPVTIPNSAVSSAASSPTISSYSRPLAITSSPTLRASIGLSSPILRPLARARRPEDEREIDGTGEAVGSLSLGI